MSFSVFVQVYKLLTANKQARRYQPPTRKRVIRDSTIILIISGVVAASTMVLCWWLETYGPWSERASSILNWTAYIPVLFIPTLVITGMCFGVWWNKLLPHKNSRYRSLTMFFARLLASAYLIAIGYAIKLSRVYWPGGSVIEWRMIWIVSESILYLFGLFQVCLALTKKDIRDVFVGMWCCCCRKQEDGVARSSTFFGRSTRWTGGESYGPEADSNDVDPPTANDVTASAVNTSVLNEDIHPNENDDNEANTSAFVESIDQNEDAVMEAGDDAMLESTVVKDGDDAMLEGTVVKDGNDAIAVVTM